MKTIATLIATLVAVTAFAAEPAKKEEVKSAPAVTATPAPHKADVKPNKSEKKEATKAEVKPASPAASK